MSCCRCCNDDVTFDGASSGGGQNVEMSELMEHEKEPRSFIHPGDAQISLSAHTPLYLPGTLFHVVRTHLQTGRRWPCGGDEPVYKVLKADKDNFNEVLISPTMVNDHMPDKVLESLEMVLHHANKLATSTTHQSNRKHDDGPGMHQRDNVAVNLDVHADEEPEMLASQTQHAPGERDLDDQLLKTTSPSGTAQPATNPVDAAGTCSADLPTNGVKFYGAADGSCNTTCSSIDSAFSPVATPSDPGPCRLRDLGLDAATPQPSNSPSVDLLVGTTSSRYPQLKARLPTPLLPLVVDPGSASSSLTSPDAAAGATVYRYSVDPPSPVAYPDDSPDHEVTPVATATLPGDADGSLFEVCVALGDSAVGVNAGADGCCSGSANTCSHGDVDGCCSGSANRFSHGGADGCSRSERQERKNSSKTNDDVELGDSSRLVDDGRCSPVDSISSNGTQYLYDPFYGHYSPAGRGYPHGLHLACHECSVTATSGIQHQFHHGVADQPLLLSVASNGYCHPPAPHDVGHGTAPGTGSGCVSDPDQHEMSKAQEQVLTDLISRPSNDFNCLVIANGEPGF